jgi:hypothetical protein
MNVYVFGNEYVVGDKRAIEVARDLEDSTELHYRALLTENGVERAALARA